MAMATLVDIDWRVAVTRVVWVPEEHRAADVPVPAAMRMLRCSERSFSQLCELGLPSADGPDGPLFDAFDLKNVALWSASEVTAVEVSMRYILGFMGEGVAELTKAIRSRYVMRTGAAGASPGILRRVHRPTPEAFGGALHSWTSSVGPPVRVDGDHFVVAAGGEVAGALTTAGRTQEVRSVVIRSAMEDLVGSGVRWHYLPASMVARPEEAFARGAASCAVLCRILAQRLGDAGFDAVAYHGWINAASPVDHGWVEVVDDDGRTKCLDPSLALLAVDNGFGSREFASAATGSMLNRIVPTRAPVDIPFADDGAGPGAVTFSCSPDVQAPGPRPARARGFAWRRPG